MISKLEQLSLVGKRGVKEAQFDWLIGRMNIMIVTTEMRPFVKNEERGVGCF